MRVALLDYELPEDRIAKHPAPNRHDARLLVVGERLEDRRIADLPSLVPHEALVVVNDTRVRRARLLGQKARTGGKVELLLVRPLAPQGGEQGGQRWEALGRGLAPYPRSLRMQFGPSLEAELEAPPAADGLLRVRLFTTDGSSVAEAIESRGELPLPPYMHRRPCSDDDARYQTVYARVPGAIAAPTAGLHLTEGLLQELRTANVRIASLTLHVGLGTFRPVAAEDLDDHPMHAEWLEVSPQLAQEIADARARGAAVVAVGTTVVRALESAADPERSGYVRPMQGETRLLIQPGYAFRVVDSLLTNFHLPRSTLLALVAAFAGTTRVLDAYREAVRRGYRFYSYGDAMWLPARWPDQQRLPDPQSSAGPSCAHATSSRPQARKT